MPFLCLNRQESQPFLAVSPAPTTPQVRGDHQLSAVEVEGLTEEVACPPNRCGRQHAKERQAFLR